MRSRRRLVLVAACIVCASIPVGSGEAQEPLPGIRYVDPVFASVDITRDIVYATPTSRAGTPVALRADVYEPHDDPATGRRVVVLVHGGGFTAGSRSQLHVEATELARRGYVAVAVDYRLVTDPPMTWCDGTSGGPSCDPRLVPAIEDATADVSAAVDVIRAAHQSMRVDPDAVAVIGWSAGAITALYLAHGAVPGGQGTAAPTSRIQAAVSIMGAMAPGDVRPGAAPALMVHGTADTVVPFSTAEAAHTAALAAGDDSRLVALPGVGHSFDPPQAAAAAGHALAFLDDVLQTRSRDRVRLTLTGAVSAAVEGRLATGDIGVRTWGGVVTGIGGGGAVATALGTANVTVQLSSFWILPIWMGSIGVSGGGTTATTTPVFFGRVSATPAAAAGSASWFAPGWRPYTLDWSIVQG